VGKRKRYSFEIDEDLIEQLKEKAKKDGVPISFIVRQLIKLYVTTDIRVAAYFVSRSEAKYPVVVNPFDKEH